MFLSPDSREVYVANQGTAAAPENTVSVISTGAQKVVDEITTGAGVHGVVVSSNGERVFVSNIYADTVCVFEPASHRVVVTIAVGAGPGGITSPAPPR